MNLSSSLRKANTRTTNFRTALLVGSAFFLASTLLLWSNLLPSLNKSATGTLNGIVIATADSKPLSGVTVAIQGTQLTTKTNVQGAYTLTSVPVGSHTLRFSCVGYKSVRMQNISVVKDSTTRINAWLQEGIDDNVVEEKIAKEKQDEGLAVKSVRSREELAQPASSQTSEVKDHDAYAFTPTLDAPKDATRKVFGGGTLHGAASGMLHQMKMSTMPHGYTVPTIQRENENFNTEEYAHQNDNEYLFSRDNPLSTFSIDVDNASYSNMRRFLSMQQFPPKDAVRSEEFINYFRYDYPQPKGTDMRTKEPFSVNTEISECPWNAKHQLVHIGLQGKEIPRAELPPSNLVFLIDVSGSMDSPEKLPLLKEAFALLTQQLRAQDRVSIVVYAGAAGVVLPPTDGNDKARILAALEQLHAGGSTAGGEGIRLAYSLANQHFLKHGNNRVILATDGDFNIGTSSEGDLTRLIEKERETGVFLSVLGFGMGNYKDSKMEKLADKGNGNYAYIDNRREAEKVLVGQMSGTLYTIAKDVKIQVEFNPATVQAYRLIGYENRLLAKEDFNNDKKDAGEIGAGHSVTALYEIVPVGVPFQNPSGNGSVDALKYQTPTKQEPTKQEPTKQESVRSSSSSSVSGIEEAMTVKIRYKEPTGSVSKLIERPVPNVAMPLVASSNNFRFSAAVAEFAMILRDSPFKANSSYNHVLNLARGATGKDEGGYRAEFIRLVETAQMLVSGVTRKD